MTQGKIFVLYPRGLESGGPEALHQLVDSIRRQGGNACLVPYPETRGKPRVERYRMYDAPEAANYDDVEGASVVAPEGRIYDLTRLKRAQTYCWWLSVDYSYLFAGARHRYVRYFDHPEQPLIQKLREGLAEVNSQKRYFAYRNKPIQHLVQSKYAQDYLATRFLETPRMLSDYTPDISQIESSNRPASERTIVSYNYAKAASLTEKVVRELNSNIEFVPIKGMQRHQVYKVLGQSLVYMDLGNHPGKDRLPREAAVAGATVVVGTRGAGANNEDVPIPAELKVPADRNLVTNAAIILENIFRDPTVYEPAMQDYRLKVKKEKKLFDDETKSIFGAVFS